MKIRRKKQQIDEQEMMDKLGLLLIEDAVAGDDEAVDLLEQCFKPVGQPLIPWRGIVAQLREKERRGQTSDHILEERGYNLRFLPMII